jgi:hypothetical protein
LGREIISEIQEFNLLLHLNLALAVLALFSSTLFSFHPISRDLSAPEVACRIAELGGEGRATAIRVPANFFLASGDTLHGSALPALR